MKGIGRKGIFGFRKFSEYTESIEVKELKKRVIRLERQNKELKRENRNLKEQTETGEHFGLVLSGNHR